MTDFQEDTEPPKSRGRAIQVASFRDPSDRNEICKRLEAAGIEIQERDEDASGGRKEWAGLNLHLYVWEIDAQRVREILDATSWKEGESFYHLPHVPVRSAKEIQDTGKLNSVLEQKVFVMVCILAVAFVLTYLIMNLK